MEALDCGLHFHEYKDQLNLCLKRILTAKL
jgi:hypothetical protein